MRHFQFDDAYRTLVVHALAGTTKEDRTGTGTVSNFGSQYSVDLCSGFPLLSLKNTPFRLPAEEMLWFLKGDCDNIQELQAKNIHIWDEWADENGDIGPMYGVTWRGRNALQQVDQIKYLETELRQRPFSRRLICSGWVPGLLPLQGLQPCEQAKFGKQSLPPCHVMFQLNVRSSTLAERAAQYAQGNANPSLTALDLKLTQRSADIMLGVPFNAAQYALLQTMFAVTFGHLPGKFIHSFGDSHVYRNHIEGAEELLFRVLPERSVPPTLIVKNERYSVLDYVLSDFEVVNYQPLPKISFPVAV